MMPEDAKMFQKHKNSNSNQKFVEDVVILNTLYIKNIPQSYVEFEMTKASLSRLLYVFLTFNLS